MADLQDLLVKIRASASEWSADMKQIQREGRELERSLKPIKDSARELGTTFAAAGGAIIASLGLMVRSTVKAGDALRDMSIRTGASVEQLSVLGFAAEQSGASIEDVGAGLRFLSRNAVEAAEGGKQQAQAFRNLGIALKDTSGNIRPVNDLLLDVADRFRNTRDGAEKSAIAMELFGRGGASLIPVLNEGREGIAAMGLELDKVGGIMSTELANAADEFNDQLNLNKKAMDGLSMAVTSALLPALTSMAQTITPIIAELSKWAAAHEGLTRAIGGTALALTGAGGLLLGLSGVLAIIPQLSKALTFLSLHPVVALAGAFAALGTAAFVFRNELASGILTLQSYIAAGLAPLFKAASQAAGAVGLTGLKDSLLATHFSLLNTRDSAADMAAVLAAGEPVIISNTKAVDDWRAKQSALPTLITGTTKALRQMLVVLGETDTLLKHDIFDPLHRMFEVDPGEAADIVGLIRDRAAASVQAEHETSQAIQKELEGVTNARIREILKGRAEDDRNWREQMDMDRRYSEEMFQSVKRTAADTFLAIFRDGEFRFKALGDSIKGIFATLANEILSTLTAKLITPLVDKISGALLGGSAGKGGALSGSIGGLLGGLGAKLGGLFGGGGAIGTINPGTGALVGGGAAMSGAAIAATAGIAAAAIGAIAWAKSQAHHEANTFVKTLEKPFGDELARIVASTADATNRLADLEGVWLDFSQAAQQFATAGSDEATVVRQALAHLDPLVQSIRGDLQSQINTLPGLQQVQQNPATQTVILNMDGRTVARLIIPNLYALTRNEGMQLIGAR